MISELGRFQLLTWQDPPLTDGGKQKSFVQLIREPGKEEEVDDKQHICRDRQEVGLEGPESHGLELQCQVLSHWICWDHPSEPDQIYWPHVPILETFPEHGERQALTIVHVPLTWVITQHSVHHDFFFSLVEPSILAAEEACGLGW